MPESDTIDFSCPACACQLRVAAAMAGVTAPCPQCGAQITAPAPASTLKHRVQEPRQMPTHISEAKIHAAAQLIRRSAQAEKNESEPAPLDAQKIDYQQITPYDIDTQTDNTDDRPRKRTLLGVIIPCTFVAVASLVVSVVLHLMGVVDIRQFQDLARQPGQSSQLDPAPAETRKAPLPESKTAQAPSLVSEVKQNTDAPANTPQQTAGKEPAPKLVAQPANRPVMNKAPVIVPAPPKQAVTPTPSRKTSPVMANIMEKGEFPELNLSPFAPKQQQEKVEELEPRPAPLVGYTADQNLEQFLSAQTLKDRLPFLLREQASSADVQNSCLQRPFKPVKSHRLIETRAGMEKDVVEYLYMVSFEDTTQNRDRLNIVLLLVERTGTHPPLINAKAFIEHYEKGLANYARQPHKENATFHCIAEANIADDASALPDEMKKSMVRFSIKSHPYYPAHFDAYLPKDSPLMSHVGTGNAFPYTSSRYCVLSFRWNTSIPGHPYIELSGIVNPSGWYDRRLSRDSALFQGGSSTQRGR